MADKLVVRPEDFERLKESAVMVDAPAVPLLEVVPDRFGVVPEGRYLKMRAPDFSPLRSVAFKQEPMATELDCIRAYRYLPLAMPKAQTLIGADWAYDCEPVWRSYHDERHGLTAAAIRWQRRLDWSSNVRRAKRARELERRRCKARAGVAT